MVTFFEGFHLTCWHVSLGNRSLVEVSSEGFCARDFAVLSWIRAKTRTGTSHCKNFILFVVIVMVLSYIYIVTINHQHHFHHHAHHAINSLVKNLSHKWHRPQPWDFSSSPSVSKNHWRSLAWSSRYEKGWSSIKLKLFTLIFHQPTIIYQQKKPFLSHLASKKP